MKTKSRNLFVVLLFAFAMLFGMITITPLTANAAAYPPDPTKISAEKIYVGGVELGLNQYVKNGETTVTTGQPTEDEIGFAWYTPDGVLLLVDYTYQGKGYEYSSGKYALVYSTGMLYVSGGGENTLKQTQSNNDGIYAVGALKIAPAGTLTIEGDNCSCLYSNNEIIFEKYLGTVNIKTTGNATAITSYDNDGDSNDEQAIIVNGGDIYVETYYPISDLTINYGAFKVSSPQYPLSQVPDISNYDGNYTLTVSENEDGSNPTVYNQDNITTFDTDKITDYKYLRIAPPAKTVINSVSVSAIDLPEIGESFVYPDETALTYDGEYLVVGCWIEKYTGTEWTYLEDTEVIAHSVKYRYVVSLRPNAGYTFSEDISDDNVTMNGSDGVVLMVFPDDAFTTMVEVALEFSYSAPALKYDITIADKDGSDTVGVDITEENYTDVLGDGTVSYDPTTNTLTLNGYKYEGEGAEDDDIGYYGLMADLPVEGLTVVLVGENSIKISGSNSAGMVFFGNSDLTIKGDGSLTINTGMQGIVMAQNSSTIKIDGGNIDITTTAIAVSTKNFVMTGGNLKITTNMFGFATLSADGAFCINGGSVEISTANAGYAFIYADIEHETYNPIKPDLSGYVGACKMIAGNNADGSDATDFNEGYLSSYKYVKVEPTHVHDHGTAWESDANEHWNECACGDKANKADHSGGTATCTQKAICTTCGKEYGEFAPHNYNITNGYKGADGHANTCSCGAHDTPVAHTPDRAEATETDPIKCTVCGYIIEPVKGHVHAPKSEWKSDEDNHWHECTGCEGQQLEKAAHTDSDTNGACDTCGYTMPVSHTHDYGTAWKTDANNHWKECECGEKSENATHIDDNGDNKCDTCDYAMPAHDPEDPTDDKDGLGAGAIVGIVIGSVAVVGIGGFALFWFVIKKKTWAEFLAIFKKK